MLHPEVSEDKWGRAKKLSLNNKKIKAQLAEGSGVIFPSLIR